MQELDFPHTPIVTFLQQLYGASSLPLCCHAQNGEILFCTDAYLHFYGAASLTECSKKIQEYGTNTHGGAESFCAAYKDNVAKAFAQSASKMSWLHILPHGQKNHVQCVFSRIHCHETPVVVATLTAVQQALPTHGEGYYRDKNMKALFEASPMAACLWNKEHRLIDCNVSFLQLIGVEHAEKYAFRAKSFYPKYQRNGKLSTKYAVELLNMALQQGEVGVEWLWRDSQGIVIPTYITLRRIQFENTIMVAEYIYDLRAIREREAHVVEIEQRNKVVLDAMPLSMSFWDKEYKLIDCNLESVQLFGFESKEEYLAKFREVSPDFQPDGSPSLEALHAKFDEALQKGISHVEWMHKHPDGTLVPVDKTCVRASHKGEDVVVTFSRDLREIHASRMLAEEAEQRNKLMLNSVPLGVHFWDADCNLIDCNLEALRLFGFDSKQEYLANFHTSYPPKQLTGENSEQVMQRYLAQALQYGHAFCPEFTCISLQDAEVIPMEITFTRTTYKGAHGVLCYLRDLRTLKAMLCEIQEVENSLRRAKNLAEKNAAAKSEFLANMSHEIRTPMNGILGLLHLMGKTPLQADQTMYLEKASFSAKNLLRIIDDILDFSKIETGRFEIESAHFMLDDILRDLEETYNLPCLEKGLDFSIIHDKHQTSLMGDALRLRQILGSLIDNAIKFTVQGAVTLRVEKTMLNAHEMQCIFSVKDTGIGIDNENIQKIFSAFTQADMSFTRQHGGTGLGLVLAQSLVRMMQGDIRVESEQGKGTTFTFTLVFSVAEQDESCIEKNREAANFLPQRHGHLLLVEDNEINQLVAEEILLQAGYTIDIANNGQEALDMLEKKCYDLVLMDIQMPVMDGLTATARIREQTRFAHLPIIAMSAHALEEDKQRSLACGMNEHTTKPIDPERLYTTIEQWIAKSHHA